MKKTNKLETAKPKTAKPPSKSALAKRVRRVAALMQKLGADMDYYGGFGEVGQHGREMQGAARIALGWADGMEAEPPPAPPVVPPLTRCPKCNCWHGGKGTCFKCGIRAAGW